MSYVIHHRSKKEIDDMIQRIRDWRRKNIRTKADRLRELQEAGILDRHGKLARCYGGNGE